MNQQFVRADGKRDIKFSHYWPFVRWIHRWRVDSPYRFPSQLYKEPVMWKSFPGHYLMTRCRVTYICHWNGSSSVQVLVCRLLQMIFSNIFLWNKIRVLGFSNESALLILHATGRTSAEVCCQWSSYHGNSYLIMTSSNGIIFRVTGLCAGNPPVTCEFPPQRPVTRSFNVFFDLRLNKRLSKQLWGWWFETPSRPLWSHCNVSL